MIGRRFGTAAAFLGASAGAVAAPVALPAGTEVRLSTSEALSSRTHAKGDMVRLRVAEEVRIGGDLIIPAGTEAVGQVVDARAKGAMGMSGRLVLRPLYLQVTGRTVRLVGAEREEASVEPGAILGMVALGSVAFTGRSALLPQGTPVQAVVQRTVMLEPSSGH